MQQKNLDYEPGFWFTVLMILPAMALVEVILLAERVKKKVCP